MPKDETPSVPESAPSDDTDPVGDSVEAQPTDSERTNNIRKLLPVHAAPYSPRAATGGKGGGEHLTVKRTVGRPRKVEKMPTTSDLEYNDLMSAEKQAFIDSDPVVKATSPKGRAEAPEILRHIRAEIAKEAAALHFQRIESEKFGKDTQTVSSRRIDALTKIAHIELEIGKLGSAAIDLRGEKFQRVFMLWIATIKEVATEILSPEQIELFFNRLQTQMEGWEDRASDAVRLPWPQKESRFIPARACLPCSALRGSKPRQPPQPWRKPLLKRLPLLSTMGSFESIDPPTSTFWTISNRRGVSG